MAKTTKPAEAPEKSAPQARELPPTAAAAAFGTEQQRNVYSIDEPGYVVRQRGKKVRLAHDGREAPTGSGEPRAATAQDLFFLLSRLARAVHERIDKWPSFAILGPPAWETWLGTADTLQGYAEERAPDTWVTNTGLTVMLDERAGNRVMVAVGAARSAPIEEQVPEIGGL